LNSPLTTDRETVTYLFTDGTIYNGHVGSGYRHELATGKTVLNTCGLNIPDRSFIGYTMDY
jgi:hypothetical protein